MAASILRGPWVLTNHRTRIMVIMTTTSPPAAAFSPRDALLKLASFGVVGGGIAGAHLVFGIGIPCPLLWLTGIQCPFCGSTRAAGALARGDLSLAWSFNALLVVGLVILGLLAIAWLVELAGGPALRPPARLRPFTQNRVYVVVGVIAAVFMLVRNLV